MSKNIKTLMVIILTVFSFNIGLPTSSLNLISTKAYGAESNQLTSLELETSSGKSLNLYSDNDYKSKNEIDNDDVEAGTVYYAKTSSDEVEIDVDGVDSDYVRVFKKNSSSSSTGKKVGDSISLSSDTTTILVRIYSEDPDKVRYDDDSYVNEYTIKVEYTGSDDDDDDDSRNVYLKSLYLSAGNISFDKRTYTYNVSVDEDINKIEIRARPNCDNDEYDDYKVKINGTKVDQDDKFKDEVSLNKGKNVIEITVEDDDDNDNTYTLNITRGVSTDSTQTSTNTNNTNTNNDNSINSNSNKESSLKTNQWVQVNGKWQYNDGKGNSVKNTWMQNYFLQSDGNMATGWLNYGGKWYYMGSDGVKKTYWQQVNGVWYYFDMQGAMQTGWIIDGGKYYYLNSNGSMAYNTTIGGYKLGANGAWTGK